MGHNYNSLSTIFDFISISKPSTTSTEENSTTKRATVKQEFQQELVRKKASLDERKTYEALFTIHREQ